MDPPPQRCLTASGLKSPTFAGQSRRRRSGFPCIGCCRQDKFLIVNKSRQQGKNAAGPRKNHIGTAKKVCALVLSRWLYLFVWMMQSIFSAGLGKRICKSWWFSCGASQFRLQYLASWPYDFSKWHGCKLLFRQLVHAQTPKTKLVPRYISVKSKRALRCVLPTKI